MDTRVIKSMLAMQRHPWEQGVCAQALYELGRDDLWIPMAYDAIKRMSPDGRLAMISGDAPVSDPASNGEVCFRAYATVSSKIDRYGLIREVCGCPDFTSEGTSAEAQAAFLMATAFRAM